MQLLRRVLFQDSPHDDVQPDQAHGSDDQEEHPACRPDAGPAQEVAENDGADEAAEAAEHADDAANHAHIARKIIGYVAIDRRLADAGDDADNEDEPGEDPDIGLEENMR